MILKNQLQNLSNDLGNKPHCIIPQYAVALNQRINEFLEYDDMPMLDKKDNKMPKCENGVCIIDINGVIAKRTGLPQEYLDLFGICDLDLIDEQLIAAKNDSEVKSIVLNINSPGGFISGLKTTGNLIAELAKEKEIVAFGDILIASAAYNLASRTNAIVVTEDCEVGSVGTYTTVEDWSKAYENAGVKVHLIKSGTYKGIGLESQPLSDADKAYLQSEVNKSHEEFKNVVLQKRIINDEDLQGQTFTGEEAMNKGFVDGFVLTLNDLINILVDE